MIIDMGSASVLKQQMQRLKVSRKELRRRVRFDPRLVIEDVTHGRSKASLQQLDAVAHALHLDLDTWLSPETPLCADTILAFTEEPEIPAFGSDELSYFVGCLVFAAAGPRSAARSPETRYGYAEFMDSVDGPAVTR